MMQFPSFERLSLALFSTSVVLAIVVVIEWLFPPQLEDFDLSATDAEQAVIPELGDSTYMPPKLDELHEMLERPLFFNNRRMPEAPKPVAVAAAPPTPLRLKLEGVAITTDLRVAVLRNLENNQLVQLAEGMNHESWTLDSVTPAGATFSRGQQVSELALDPQAGRR